MTRGFTLTAAVAALLLAGCSSGASGTGGSGGAGGGTAGGAGGGSGGAGGGSGGAGGGTAGGAGGGTAGGAGGGTAGGAGGGGGGSTVYDIPSGTVLIDEPFDNNQFSARGWYDGTAATISTTEISPGGGAGSFQCQFAVGATGCTGGTPARHKHSASDRVYVRMFIKFSSNWVGSGVAYHPHMFHFTTTSDGDYIGPATSHLTTYIEVVNRRGMLALQDSLNVDPACVLLNNNNFQGCNGAFSTFVFSEQRSVASCNGLVGDVDGRDCFSTGGTGWYSSRAWSTSTQWFTDTAGPQAKFDWHKLEAYFEMNSIQAGKGVPNGRIRLWLDGQKVVTSDAVLFRTNANAAMKFSQFLMLPYIGVGSPVAQSLWIDQLKVGTGLLP